MALILRPCHLYCVNHTNCHSIAVWLQEQWSRDITSIYSYAVEPFFWLCRTSMIVIQEARTLYGVRNVLCKKLQGY